MKFFSLNSFSREINYTAYTQLLDKEDKLFSNNTLYLY